MVTLYKILVVYPFKITFYLIYGSFYFFYLMIKFGYYAIKVGIWIIKELFDAIIFFSSLISNFYNKGKNNNYVDKEKISSKEFDIKNSGVTQKNVNQYQNEIKKTWEEPPKIHINKESIQKDDIVNERQKYIKENNKQKDLSMNKETIQNANNINENNKNADEILEKLQETEENNELNFEIEVLKNTLIDKGINIKNIQFNFYNGELKIRYTIKLIDLSKMPENGVLICISLYNVSNVIIFRKENFLCSDEFEESKKIDEFINIPCQKMELNSISKVRIYCIEDL